MKVNNVSLAAVGVKMSQYPTDEKPEIAFAGKSNVGKSTLINAMIGRKALARTSSQPGKTRTINFYDVERNNREEKAKRLGEIKYSIKEVFKEVTRG